MTGFKELRGKVLQFFLILAFQYFLSANKLITGFFSYEIVLYYEIYLFKSECSTDHQSRIDLILVHLGYATR